MKPVDQTLFGPRPNGKVGNCVSACIASLLDLDIADVPYFMGTDDEPDDLWKKRINRWLAPRGFSFMHLKTDGKRFAQWPPGYFILMGRSPRGLHAVVAKGGKIVHDPHPSRAGLKSIDGFVVLLPLDPAKCRTRSSRRSR
jgi:hypothetical protein